jgi:hypothetical protein
MLRGKKGLLNKGYVMIYTMIIGLIIIVTMGYIFKLEVKRKLCILEEQKNVTEKVYNKETTDYLFFKMNEYIVSKVVSLDELSVQNLFVSNTGAIKIGNDKYYICYDKSTHKFWVYQFYLNNKMKIDEYEFHTINNKVKFIYDHTEYVQR